METRRISPTGTRTASKAERRPRRRMRRAARLALVWIAGLASFAPLAARAAGETMHEIVWAHAQGGSVRKFIVFVSATKDAQTARQVDVGKPPGEPSGEVEMFSALIPLRDADFVAIAAMGFDGRVGALSSWGTAQPSRPGQPLVIVP